MKYERITVDPQVMGGMSCIRGMRFPVATLLAMLAARMSREQILEEHPDLDPEGIDEALGFAAEAGL